MLSPYTPGQMVFGMDMFFRQICLNDWVQLKKQCRAQATANNAKENKKRIVHTYKVEDLVLICQKSYEQAKGSKIAPETLLKYTSMET